ncbi:hydroxymethylbilane synthase [Humisphaera borealis]|uniref:Porphobilinogen deaminase n=1 Tax=Humisphaera borealis TaxID=2807512 RepID=A0A7M2WWC0_9BACT|nr:hydroxymethylbilane synthase [Humisphaera borealis]QOV89614.1 hydroxymethylbilane synthase [Humisphaera borealis]
MTIGAPNHNPQPDLTLRLGTRGSMLARAQSGWVARQIEARNPGVRVELVIISTSGDQITDKPLHAFGGKGLFTKELEQALLAGSVDFAVHSFKDVPVTMPLVDIAELVIAAVPPREDPTDAWASLKSKSFRDLPAGAKVGTGSLRRRSQILHHRPDLLVEPIRGNIDTRLRKLREGQYDAVVLATAGLKRGGVMDETWMTPIDTADMLPAPGQGALALQCRQDAEVTRRILGSMHDVATAACVELEREIVRQLEGDCHSPIAALATINGDRVLLRSAVGGRDGIPPVAFALSEAPVNEASSAVVAVMNDLQKQGARQRLLA